MSFKKHHENQPPKGKLVQDLSHFYRPKEDDMGLLRIAWLLVWQTGTVSYCGNKEKWRGHKSSILMTFIKNVLFFSANEL